MSTLTIEQLHTFHAKDRLLFSKLVLQFSRPLAQSLLVMATCFWLENFLLEDISSALMDLSNFSDLSINTFVDETVLCLKCLDSPKDFNHIPLTTKVMKNKISFQILYQYRYTFITGIKAFLNTKCSRIFCDIIEQVLPSSSFSSHSTLPRSLIIPGFLPQTFGNINIIPNFVVSNDIFKNNNSLFSSHGVWSWNSGCIATENDRTMFITFSRGYPVSQEELQIFFTTRFGENCVQSIYMSGNNKTNRFSQRQSLYAKLVVDSVATVDRILNGKENQTFSYNGKDIRARKHK